MQGWTINFSNGFVSQEELEAQRIAQVNALSAIVNKKSCRVCKNISIINDDIAICNLSKDCIDDDNGQACENWELCDTVFISSSDITNEVESAHPCEYFASEPLVINVGDVVPISDINSNIDLDNALTTVTWVKMIQARTHRKRRINKKWLKRYGYKKVMMMTSGWRMETHTDGTIEFIKEVED